MTMARQSLLTQDKFASSVLYATDFNALFTAPKTKDFELRPLAIPNRIIYVRNTESNPTKIATLCLEAISIEELSPGEIAVGAIITNTNGGALRLSRIKMSLKQTVNSIL